MALPEPDYLLLLEAVDRVARSCGVDRNEAEQALKRAFTENVSLRPWGYPPKEQSRSIFPEGTHWKVAAIDWNASTAKWPRGHFHCTDLIQVQLSRVQLIEWILRGQRSVAPTAAPPAAVTSSVAIDAVPADTLPQAGTKETTIARNTRWYTRHKEIQASDPHLSHDAIFDKIAKEHFGSPDSGGTVKKAVNEIRRSRGETGSRKMRRR
jgi:hypothetical protein